MRNFPDETRGKIKTHILFSIRKSCRLWENVEKYGAVRQAADGNIT